MNFNLKNKIGKAKNLILRGYILADTHFVTQCTHVSRHPRVKIRKQKQFFKENCFENVVSDL